MLDLRPLVKFSCNAILKNPNAVSIQCWLSLSIWPSLLSRCLATKRERERGDIARWSNMLVLPCCSVTSLESLLSPWWNPAPDRAPLAPPPPLADTNCPTREEAPLLCSWKVTSLTMMLSSSTDPQPVHTASPRAGSYSMSVPPHCEQTVDMAAVGSAQTLAIEESTPWQWAWSLSYARARAHLLPCSWLELFTALIRNITSAR